MCGWSWFLIALSIERIDDFISWIKLTTKKVSFLPCDLFCQMVHRIHVHFRHSVLIFTVSGIPKEKLVTYPNNLTVKGFPFINCFSLTFSLSLFIYWKSGMWKKGHFWLGSFLLTIMKICCTFYSLQLSVIKWTILVLLQFGGIGSLANFYNLYGNFFENSNLKNKI